jgi:hypothetical protein
VNVGGMTQNFTETVNTVMPMHALIDKLKRRVRWCWGRSLCHMLLYRKGHYHLKEGCLKNNIAKEGKVRKLIGKKYTINIMVTVLTVERK